MCMCVRMHIKYRRDLTLFEETNCILTFIYEIKITHFQIKYFGIVWSCLSQVTNYVEENS